MEVDVGSGDGDDVPCDPIGGPSGSVVNEMVILPGSAGPMAPVHINLYIIYPVLSTLDYEDLERHLFCSNDCDRS